MHILRIIVPIFFDNGIVKLKFVNLTLNSVNLTKHWYVQYWSDYTAVSRKKSLNWKQSFINYFFTLNTHIYINFSYNRIIPICIFIIIYSFTLPNTALVKLEHSIVRDVSNKFINENWINIRYFLLCFYSGCFYK